MPSPETTPPAEHLTRLRIRKGRIDPQDMEGIAAMDWAIDELTERKSYFQMVQEFHRALGESHRDTPGWPEPRRDRTNLRVRLIGEEFREVRKASAEGDLAALAKELADLIYVACGMADEFGLDLDRVFPAVHESNMSKTREATWREDGKLLKGPSYRPPNIARVLGLVDA